MPIMSCLTPSRHPDTPESTRNSSQQCQVGDLGVLDSPPDWAGGMTDCFRRHGGAPCRGWIPAFAGTTSLGVSGYFHGNDGGGGFGAHPPEDMPWRLNSYVIHRTGAGCGCDKVTHAV